MPRARDAAGYSLALREHSLFTNSKTMSHHLYLRVNSLQRNEHLILIPQA